VDAMDIAANGDGALIPTLVGRKSVLMGMLASGFVIANAARPSAAVAAGKVPLLASAQPAQGIAVRPTTPCAEPMTTMAG